MYRVVVEKTKEGYMCMEIHETKDTFKHSCEADAFQEFFYKCADAITSMNEDDIKTDVTLWDDDGDLIEYFTFSGGCVSDNRP